MVYYCYHLFGVFYILVFSGFLQFKGNFVLGSKHCNLGPLSKICKHSLIIIMIMTMAMTMAMAMTMTMTMIIIIKVALH